LVAQIIEQKDPHTIVYKIFWEGFVFFHMNMKVALACGGIGFIDIKVDIIYVNIGTKKLIVFVEVMEFAAPRREAHFKEPIFIFGSSFQ